METTSWLRLETAKSGNRCILRFFAAEDRTVDGRTLPLFSLGFAELCQLAGLGPNDQERILADRKRTIYSQGWQSWCHAGELGRNQRVKRARVVPHIRAYCDWPGKPEGRGEVLSHMISYIRSGSLRLCLLSRPSPEASLAPVGFRIGRQTLNVQAEACAQYASFGKGECLAETWIFAVEDYFAMKDALGEAFAQYRHFDRLAFLGWKDANTGGNRLVPGGYESWYNHYTDIDDAIISRDLDALTSSPNLIRQYYLQRKKPTVFQIDDGWERAVGDWRVHEGKFPRGMKVFAREIEERGMIPGIWIAPLVVTKSAPIFREKPQWLLRDEKERLVAAGFNDQWDGSFYCLDISQTEVQDYLAGIFDTLIQDWGYRYLKLDFLYAAFLPGVGKGGSSAFLNYDKLMKRLTARQSGPDGKSLAYLGCGAPLEASYRHFPLMRIGADTKEIWADRLRDVVVRHQGMPSARSNLTHTLGRTLLDGTVFVCDPDVVFCRKRGVSLGETEKELIALVAYLFASQIMFSDDASQLDAEEEAFTNRIVGLYDRLAGQDFGAERIAPGIFGVFSRDETMKGVINLSDRPFEVKGFQSGAAILDHGRAMAGGRSFEPHSISLYRY